MVDVVGLSLLYVLLCLPVITIVPATAALYYTVVKCIRHGAPATFIIYLRAFRNNLRQGILVTLICLAVAIPLLYGYLIMLSNAVNSDIGAVMYMAYYVALIIPVGVFCYLCPLMGRFQFTKKDLFHTAFAMSIRHLPSTVVMALLTMLLATFSLQNWWAMLVAPVFCAFISSLLLERIFPKYLDVEEVAKLKDVTVEELLEKAEDKKERKAKK